jgi:hypothetical protein
MCWYGDINTYHGGVAMGSPGLRLPPFRQQAPSGGGPAVSTGGDKSRPSSVPRHRPRKESAVMRQERLASDAFSADTSFSRNDPAGPASPIRPGPLRRRHGAALFMRCHFGGSTNTPETRTWPTGIGHRPEIAGRRVGRPVRAFAALLDGYSAPSARRPDMATSGLLERHPADRRHVPAVGPNAHGSAVCRRGRPSRLSEICPAAGCRDDGS